MNHRLLPAFLLSILPILPLASQAPKGVPVSAEFQVWADGNRDATLQPAEAEELVRAALRFFGEPHPADNPFDTFLDANHDGRIGPDDIERAWRELILPRLQRLLPENPEAARLVDVNGDGRIEPEEALVVVEFLISPASTQPHKASSPLDGTIDANRDGRVGADEIAGFREQLVRVTVLLPGGEEIAGGRTERGRRFLDDLADVNSDGNVDPEEERQREVALGSPHAARSPIDKRLDANGNGRVEQAEIDQAFKTQDRQDAEWAAMEREAGDREALQQEAREVEQKERADAETAAREAAAREAADKPATAVQPATQPAAASTGTAAPAATQTAPAAAATTTTAPASSGATTATTATTSTGVSLEQVEIDEIFPVFRSYYDDHPIGTATLKNGTSAAIENVKVEIYLPRLMDAKKPCTAPTTIAAGSSGKVEITAVFNDEVLQISEGTKALATITVSYTSGGTTESKDFVSTVSFLEQNAMTWDDDDRAAAFVTAKDPVIQQIRSAVVTNVDKAVTAVDKQLRTAMAIHHLLVKYGLKYWTDPNAAYETVAKTKSAIDHLQFPQWTLALKTGDCDDLAILTCSLLETAGVESAFVTVPGHIFVAFALAMTPDEAKKTFVKPDDLIFENDKAWVPWEITALSGGFLKAWETGAKEWRAGDAKGEAGFHPVQAAWKKYKPVAFSAIKTSVTMSTTVVLPSESEWTKAYTEEVKTFVNQQIATQVQKLQAEIKANPSKPEYVNRLGVLYARWGLVKEAETELLKLDKQDYVPALINLGNLAFLKPDLKTALAYYSRAAKKDSTSAKALLGVARTNHEQENYGAAQEAYAALKKVDAALAAQYAYLELKGTDAEQAAKAGKVTDKVEWEEK